MEQEDCPKVPNSSLGCKTIMIDTNNPFGTYYAKVKVVGQGAVEFVTEISATLIGLPDGSSLSNDEEDESEEAEEENNKPYFKTKLASEV